MQRLILYSGGMDSLASLHREMKQSHHSMPKPKLLYFHYGQATAKREIPSAQYFAQFFDVELHILELGDVDVTKIPVWVFSGIPLHHTEPKEDFFIPGRNINFILQSAMKFYSKEIRETHIIVSAHKSDTISGDCSPKFFKSMEYALDTGMSTPEYPQSYSVRSPLMNMSKSDIIQMVVTAGLPYENTWSCYGAGMLPCGICHQCKERQDSFFSLGLTDRTKYMEAK